MDTGDKRLEPEPCGRGGMEEEAVGIEGLPEWVDRLTVLDLELIEGAALHWRRRCRRARAPCVPLAISSNDLHAFEGILHLSAAIEAAHVCMAELILVWPRCVGMHTVKQVNANPSQKAHVSVMPAPSARTYCRRSHKLPG
jgi:hypothetical protein